MSRSPSLTTGSGTSGGGIAATRCGFGGEKRLKSDEASGSAVDENSCLKTGNAERPKFGNETTVAPITVKAASDTATTGTQLEDTGGAPSGDASGCSGACTSLCGTSVNCVPYSQQNMRRGGKTAKRMRACSPDSGSNHEPVWLIPGYTGDHWTPIPQKQDLLASGDRPAAMPVPDLAKTSIYMLEHGLIQP